MPLHLRGFDDLKNDVINMASRIENGSVKEEALVKGAAPIEEQMLHNASTDPKIITQTLYNSIGTSPVRTLRSTGGKRITIGVHHKELGAYYANPVEYGHGGPAPAPAHPFVRPAFDTRADEAYENMKAVLRAALK